MKFLVLLPFLFLSVGLVPASIDTPPPIPKSSDKAPDPKPAPPKPEVVPSLKAPERIEVEPGDLFTVKATTSAKWVGFYAMDDGIKQFHLEDLFEGAKAKVGTYVATVPKDAPPGKVYRLLIYAGNSTAAAEPVLTQIVVKGTPIPPPNPPPGPPNPPPPPGPQPAPTGKVSFFVVVEDTKQPGAWRGDVLGSPKVEAFYRQLRGQNRTGAIHRLIDITDPDGDPLATYFKGKSAGKTLPYLWMLDDKGGIVKELPCPTDPDKFIAAFDFHAGPRSLGLVKQKINKAEWKEFGTAKNTPLIDRANWKVMNLRTFLPGVYDQNGRGQCVASSLCTVTSACFAQVGLSVPYLSAGDLYSRINGGRDNGATLPDGMAEMMKNGVTTVTNVPYVWDGRRHDTTAIIEDRKNYRLVEVYLCPTFESAASAVQQGFFLEEALTWYNSYMTPGSDGWLPPPGRGVAGGHALCGFGLAKKGNVWGIMTRNSWGSSWGGSSDGTLGSGNCVIPEANFDDVESNGFFAVRAVVQRPTPLPFPMTFTPRGVEYALAP